MRFAFDGRPATWWSTPSAQQGDEWVHIGWDRARDIRCLELSIPKERVGEYPRRLVVTSIVDGRERMLFDGPVIDKLIEGIARDSRDPRIRIDLPANQSGGLRLSQRGTAEFVPWSIGEIRLWEQR